MRTDIYNLADEALPFHLNKIYMKVKIYVDQVGNLSFFKSNSVYYRYT